MPQLCYKLWQQHFRYRKICHIISSLMPETKIKGIFCRNKHSLHTLIFDTPLRKACVWWLVVLCLYDHCNTLWGHWTQPSLVGFRPRLGYVCFRLLGRPVGDFPALQHRPPVSLHVVEQRDEDGWAQQQLGKEAEQLIKRRSIPQAPCLHPVSIWSLMSVYSDKMDITDYQMCFY